MSTIDNHVVPQTVNEWKRATAYALSPVSLYPVGPAFPRIGMAQAYDAPYVQTSAPPDPAPTSHSNGGQVWIPNWALALGAIGIIWWLSSKR